MQCETIGQREIRWLPVRDCWARKACKAQEMSARDNVRYGPRETSR